MDRLRALTCVAAAGLLLAAGCRDHSRSRVVVGHVRAQHEASPALHACLRRYAPELRLSPTTSIVEREGPLGGSLTIADAHSPWLWGCDLAPGRRKVCGGAVGRWRHGRLNDPRLDIGCKDRGGRTLGAAWVVPLPHAHSIAVQEGDRSDVYPVAGDLPVRIWTRHVVIARSGAVFDVSQVAEDGTRLAHERLRAFVAG